MNSDAAEQTPAKPSAPPVNQVGVRQFLRLDDLVLDRRLQQREDLYDDGQVKEIRESLSHISAGQRSEPTKTGNDEDALEVWSVRGVLYVVDGFQRHQAHRLEGFTWVECVIYTGTWKEAKERSYLVNRHGKQLTARDKRHKLLDAVEHWHDEVTSGRMSYNELARRTNLSVAFVSKALREAGIDTGDEITVTRGGQSYTMKTKGIGRPPKEKPADGSTSGTSGASEFSESSKPKPASGGGGSGGGRSSRFVPANPPPEPQESGHVEDVPPAGQMDAAQSGETSPQRKAPASETEQVLNVPSGLVPELKALVLEHGSFKLQRALRGQLL